MPFLPPGGQAAWKDACACRPPCQVPSSRAPVMHHRERGFGVLRAPGPASDSSPSYLPLCGARPKASLGCLPAPWKAGSVRTRPLADTRHPASSPWRPVDTCQLALCRESPQYGTPRDQGASRFCCFVAACCVAAKLADGLFHPPAARPPPRTRPASDINHGGMVTPLAPADRL